MKINRTFTFLILFFIGSFLLAQEELEYVVPNYELIKKNIVDESSEFFYPDMLRKLEADDTLLTPEQYHHLYYGYVFQDEYSPYARFSKNDELNQLINSDNLDIERITDLLKEALQENPMDLESRLMLAGIYHNTGGKEHELKLVNSFEGLIEALLMSGDGRSPQTAFYVISGSHEYLLLDISGLRSEGQALLNTNHGAVDQLSIAENDFGIAEMFFNVNILFKKQMEIFEGK